MTNPAAVSCPAGEWAKVAENVTTGVITVKGNESDGLYYDYRLTGAAAPTALTTAIPFDGLQLSFQTAAAIDVYVWNETDNAAVVVAHL